MPTTSRGAPYPDTTDGNNAPADLEALADWVNDRPGIATVTTTQRNALSGVDLWAGRHVWNTTTGRVEYYTGSTWLPTPMPGRILGETTISGGGVKTGVSFDDVSATGATFVAPASGVVLVQFEGSVRLKTTGSGSTGQGSILSWAVKSGSTTVTSGAVLTTSIGVIPEFPYLSLHKTLRVTGLTPGSSYTYKLGHSISGLAGETEFSSGRITVLEAA